MLGSVITRNGSERIEMVLEESLDPAATARVLTRYCLLTAESATVLSSF